MATSKHPQDSISSVSAICKHSNKNIFSNVSLPSKTWHNTVNSLTNNGNRLVENSQIIDLNENVQDNAKTTRVSPKTGSKIEKSTFPNLLCLKKVSTALDEINFKTLNVNTLSTDNISWNDYYNVNGNATKNIDTFHSNSAADYNEKADDPSSSSKRYQCLLNPNKNRKSFHQNVEDALSSLLWQPYEYQTKSSATSMSSRFVLS